ncbi:transcriptional regulator, AraC family [Frankia casuarinae]|uniref:Transcriptional regulator, AraC family n=1 Tax=Frankia casuarinae (strain DSM 45818 / CECT 9043 / HFP020203 / CcI3) TaxID=106370 RepID=Q2J9Q8_FRACC|nr:MULTISPECIES: helix-turn-helix domain-containing protein [Frankia]ABD11984.1 transcriptional regulator, AraC family [Frankia casuarinae]ETA01873.1 transcriptional regulator, AraC family [Frankia sp. CcI6]EYT92516.1 transcriptional regulator, AraC family [Frankia casuarinae]KDA43035.1 transcriptional regulator, AraC family [Frankia sp. BMG5.23]KEZ36482.1 DNA-binding domain-containing protein, AraC-type [Frankia sp. CeD]
MTSRPVAARRLIDLARLRRVRDRIDREYARPLDVEALARGAHMSAGHLSREFRLAYGESPYAYLMARRIERAMALLRRGDLSVTEVCFAVGCSSLATAALDGTFARLQASGAEVVQEPTEQPYGVRDCASRDPAGNLIRINELR